MAAGQDPSRFWDKTLRLIFTILKGCQERDRRAHNERAWHAHQTAFLTVYHPDKPTRFVKLEKLQLKAQAATPSKPKSWEDDFAALSAWASKGRPN